MKVMMLQGFHPILTLEEPANSLCVPVSDPIPLSPLDQTGICILYACRGLVSLSNSLCVVVRKDKNHVLLGLLSLCLLLLFLECSLYCICGIWI